MKNHNNDYPSLDYAHDEIKEQVDFQISRIHRLETTAGVLVGISITAMSILAGNPDLTSSCLYLALPALFLFAITIYCGIYAMWQIGYYRPVDPVALFNDYLDVEEDIAKFVATSVMVDAFIKNEVCWRQKRRQFLCCVVPLAIAIMVLAVAVFMA